MDNPKIYPWVDFSPILSPPKNPMNVVMKEGITPAWWGVTGSSFFWGGRGYIPSPKLMAKAPENGWLEHVRFLLGSMFRGYVILVSGRVHLQTQTIKWIHCSYWCYFQVNHIKLWEDTRPETNIAPTEKGIIPTVSCCVFRCELRWDK